MPTTWQAAAAFRDLGQQEVKSKYFTFILTINFTSKKLYSSGKIPAK